MLEKQAVSKIDENLIKIGVKASKREEVIRAMGAMLVEQGYVKESYVQALLDREKEFPTGIMAAGLGVAIPHAAAGHVNQTTAAVWVLEHSIPFQVMGGSDADVVDVNAVFMLAVTKPQEHLLFLQKLMGLFQNEAVMLKIKNAMDPKAVAEIINQEI
ncbi:phosphoenolpyruvate-dependent sugar phosphotransferase system eiia 2 [Lucifera butyrica]|uniref:Phosphoenolpyruvate-dependent sugar phosphotransferase system eiia 2 n=1 Tax=Lucifera butyrica TaxID=1351585 RepID=A0A498R9W9_9FIRM|nr:PTS sugar transporter subunit IIA [Lucifera butyrica]VBB08181.1 phosphoenolpyruvate-dependent sugar phosphotransferase system eiia 2 [Lucifera butyrica]